jgi:hypothetical protein
VSFVVLLPSPFHQAPVGTQKEHPHPGAANPQIAYDKEFAKTSISTAEVLQIRS